jgi:SagB-type dehydrogenase family enzyme
MAGIGEQFQQETKYRRNAMPRGGLDWQSQPEVYKQYPHAKIVKLPHFAFGETPGLKEVLKKRRSIRQFNSEPLTLEELSYLLWSANGINRREMDYEFRTAPSAGALYPIETYLVINNVEELEKGIYHYNVKHHQLEEIRLGDFGRNTAEAALGQGMCASAGAVFIWTAVFQRSKWKYQQRAYRYVYLDAGHIAGNLALAATSLGLGSCQIAALFDDEVNELIEVDGVEESVLYMSVTGRYSQ